MSRKLCYRVVRAADGLDFGVVRAGTPFAALGVRFGETPEGSLRAFDASPAEGWFTCLHGPGDARVAVRFEAGAPKQIRRSGDVGFRQLRDVVSRFGAAIRHDSWAFDPDDDLAQVADLGLVRWSATARHHGDWVRADIGGFDEREEAEQFANDYSAANGVRSSDVRVVDYVE